MNPKYCPECESTNTESVNTTIHTDTIEIVRVCRECPTQYVMEFASPILTDVVTE